MLRAVLFDYGLTLVSFTYPRAELLAVLEEVRPWLGPSAPDAESLMREVLEPLEDDLDTIGEDEVDYMALYERAWRRAGLDVPRETLCRILDLEQRCWDRAVRMAPGALETLDRLRARGLRTAVASNAPFPPHLLHRQLRVNGLAERLDAVVFSSEVGRRKPAPELYLAALDRVGVPAAQALYVGDRVSEDYDGPRRVGMRAVLCTALARRPIRDGVPTIEGLAELDGLLDRHDGPDGPHAGERDGRGPRPSA
ncbi:MAG TPA: HAD family hydrolase [Candidatus Eisenbacteria bacterium]|nr:HAD family hydrolase [Candidatus Eisenbacteria bacterium]